MQDKKIKRIKKNKAKIGQQVSSPPQAPSEQQINELVARYNAADFVLAQELAGALTKEFPRHPFGWKVLGLINNKAGRLHESVESMQQFVRLQPGDAEAHNNLGVILEKLGRLTDAEASFRKTIILNPNFPDAHNNLGNILQGFGRLGEAEVSYRDAIRVKTDFAEAHVNLGVVLKNLGRLGEAESSYREAIRLKPDSPIAHNNLGSLLRDLGHFAEAESSFCEAIRLKPDYADAHINLGAVLQGLKRLSEAVISCREAIRLKPDSAEAQSNLGGILQDLGRLGEAEISLREAIRINPEFAEAHNNLGIVLMELGSLDMAVISFLEAIRLMPDLHLAHSNLGNIYKDSGRFSEAEWCYREAIRLKPDSAGAYSNLGTLFIKLGRLEEGYVNLVEAVHLDSECIEALATLGNLLATLGRLVEAEACLLKAVSLKWDFPEAHINLGVCQQNVGRLSEALASFRVAMALERYSVDAHSNLLFGQNYAVSLSTEDILNEAKSYGFKVTAKSEPKFNSWLFEPDTRKLRIGFVSGDFRNHPVGFFIEGLLKQLDKEQFAVVAFVTTPLEDEVTPRLKSYFEEWIPVYGLRNAEAATLIREKRINILVDLSGHTAFNRLPVFSYKPAPVQVSWLGYFATTGLPEMDYLLGDPYMSPQSEQHHFTEKVKSLAETWMCLTPPSPSVTISSLPALSNGFVTFGSFGNLAKINDRVVELWAAVLQGVPHSKLMLKAKQLGDPLIAKETQNRFAQHGIVAERVLIEGPSLRIDYLDAYNRIDIVLDTFPYPGGTTSVEALWMGVPVLTLKGDRFLSHLGESIAHNAQQSNWIAQDSDDYANKAIAFASDLQSLARLKATLRDQVLRTPLFDSRRFANNFADALWEMWEEKSKTAFGYVIPQAPSEQQINELVARYNAADFVLAQELAGALTKEFPRHPLGWKVLGLINNKAGRLHESVESMRQVVRLQPGDAEAHNNLGVILEKLGQLRESENAYRRAISLNPDFSFAHNNLGNVLRTLGYTKESEGSYREAIRLKPDYADAHYNLGNALKELGRLVEAEASYHEAIRLKPDYADAYHNLGSVEIELGRPTDAEASFRKTIILNPNFPDAHNNLGNILQGFGRLGEAEVSYREAIRVKTDYAEAHVNLGVVLKNLDRLDEAESSYREAIRLKPDYADAYNNHGILLLELGRLIEAEGSLFEAIRLKPDFPAAYSNLGATLQELGRPIEAEICLREAIRLKPDFSDAYINLGATLQDLGRLGEAEISLREAIRLKPDFFHAYINLGATLLELGRVIEAESSFRVAIRHKPDSTVAHNNLGSALQDLGRHGEAEISFREAIRLKPDNHDARANLGLSMLSLGNFKDGLEMYQSRLGNKQLLKFRRNFSFPLWLGDQPLAGKTVLLHAEQGLGDTVQFCRFVPIVSAQGARVILEVQRSLINLLKDLPGVSVLVAAGDPLPAFDFHCPLPSLPLALKTEIESIPQAKSYLKAEPDLERYWKEQLKGNLIRIGISWQGSKGKVDVGRSFDVSLFEKIAQLPQVRLISLQRGYGSEQLMNLPKGMEVVNLGDDFDTGGAFVDTAAVMKNLDLVITSDTAIAHVAGALGVKVWVALKHAPDWRWLLDREDSPWYPSMRLFRQQTREDWRGVFGQIEQALVSFIANRSKQDE